MRKLGNRLSYANLMATIAVFLALGVGTVYAASKINGKQIKANSIPGNRLKVNSVTSQQINPATLGTVPNASHSTNADKAGGVQPAHASFFADANTAEQQLFSVAGLTMSASCNASGQPVIRFSSNQPNVMWHYDYTQLNGSANGNGDENASTPPSSQAFNLPNDGTYRVRILFVDAAGSSLSGEFYGVKSAFSGAKACVITGNAFGA